VEVKKCEECGVLYEEEKDACPSCAALQKYIQKYPELFMGSHEVIARLHAFVAAEAGLTVPPIVIAAMHRYNTHGTRVCQVCKSTRPDDDMVCPHCDEAKDYLRRSGLQKLDRNALETHLNTLSRMFHGELGYNPPPVLVAAAYKILFMEEMRDGETRH
jgi:RNA polymerase subunit RPABC4/transcription elongation factor Spt4